MMGARTDVGLEVASMAGTLRGTQRQVIVALALIESRRLVRHPAFLVGLGLPLLVAVTGGEELRDLETLTLTLVLLAWGTLIATNLAVLRSRRGRTEELLSSLPSGEDTRIAAHLGSGIAAGLVSVPLLAMEFALAAQARASVSMPPVAPLGIGVIIVIGGAVVGVFAARWLPHLVFGYVAVIVTAALQGNVGDATGSVRRIAALAFVHVPQEVAPGFTPPTTYLMHSLYLVALVVLVGIGALARRRFGLTLAIGAAVALATVIATAVVQVQPLGEHQLIEAAARLTDPSGFQTCRSIEGVDYCAYGSAVDDRDFRSEWAATIAAVQARLPADTGPILGPVTQRVAPVVEDRNCAAFAFEETIPVEVATLVTPDLIWPADGLLHPGIGAEERPCEEEPLPFFDLAVQAGSLAVGLPPTTHGLRVRCVADGQARSALALWLGAQAVEDGPSRLQEIADDEYLAASDHLDFWGTGELADRASPWTKPPPWGTRFHRDDLTAALALVALPADQVEALLEDWEALTDPGTTTRDLLVLAGLDDSEAGSGTDASTSAQVSAVCP